MIALHHFHGAGVRVDPDATAFGLLENKSSILRVPASNPFGFAGRQLLRPRKSQPRNDAGEIFTTAAAGFTPGFASVTNRFEYETGNPRKFARK
jgi:hypothetical protein